MLRLVQLVVFVLVTSSLMTLGKQNGYVAGFFGLIATLAVTRVWLAIRYRARIVKGPGRGEFHFEFPEPQPPRPRADVLPPIFQPPQPELRASERRRD